MGSTVRVKNEFLAACAMWNNFRVFSKLNKIRINLFFRILLSERMQRESGNLENPSAVHVTLSTGQVTVWLEHRLVQVNHSLALTPTAKVTHLRYRNALIQQISEKVNFILLVNILQISYSKPSQQLPLLRSPVKTWSGVLVSFKPLRIYFIN